jgi:hypothetical protein
MLKGFEAGTTMFKQPSKLSISHSAQSPSRNTPSNTVLFSLMEAKREALERVLNYGGDIFRVSEWV